LEILHISYQFLGYSIPGAVVGVGLLIISSFVDTKLGHMLFSGTFLF
jgi:iron(III) transport system permease protein